MTSLPDWMTTPAPLVAAETPVGHQKRNGVRHALTRFMRLVSTLLPDGSLAEDTGLLQHVDARAKLLSLIALLLAVSFVQRLPLLAAAYAMCIVLALLSRFRGKHFLGIWFVVPAITLLCMLPAATNLVTPGKPVVSLSPSCYLTDNGIVVATRLVLRTAISVAIAVLLMATTRPHRLFRALRMLGVPKLCVMLLTLMTRYLVVMARVAEEIHLGKLSRSIMPGTARQERQWAAAGIGMLFQRTKIFGEAVYLAMLSRGYTGEAYLLDEPHWHWWDWLCISIAVAACTALLLFR